MKKYDIAIVGGGASGMAAAIAAAENGASVMIIEANPKVGGNGIFPMGIYGVDSPVQRRSLIYTSTEEAFRSCMEYSHWKLDARLVRKIIDKTGDTIAWLEDMGVHFEQVIHHTPNQAPEVFHIVAPPVTTGTTVMNAMEKRANELGVEYMLRTRAKKLMLDGQGRACGVIAENAQGETVTVEAGKVILCAGGFAGNEELIAKFFPKYNPDNFIHMHGMRYKGEGILMALEAGAEVEGNFAMEMGAPKMVDGNEIGLLLGKPFNIWLNADGERYCNESDVDNFVNAANASSRQKDGIVYVFFNKELYERALVTPRSPLERISIPAEAESRMDKTVQKKIDAGLLRISDSLDGIAEFMGVPAEKLRATVEEYNNSCLHGYDEYFGKSRRDMLAIEGGPYYVIKAGVDMIATHGGIRTNTDFEALKADRTPVGNLYIAGTDVGGLDADVYNMTMSGHAFGFAVNTGRLAGEAASRA